MDESWHPFCVARKRHWKKRGAFQYCNVSKELKIGLVTNSIKLDICIYLSDPHVCLYDSSETNFVWILIWSTSKRQKNNQSTLILIVMLRHQDGQYQIKTWNSALLNFCQWIDTTPDSRYVFPHIEVISWQNCSEHKEHCWKRTGFGKFSFSFLLQKIIKRIYIYFKKIFIILLKRDSD